MSRARFILTAARHRTHVHTSFIIPSPNINSHGAAQTALCHTAILPESVVEIQIELPSLMCCGVFHVEISTVT
ncbi:hypothetical protein RSAG8_06970, partial [Rhizoctonia solani AG-8 WAC10335]